MSSGGIVLVPVGVTIAAVGAVVLVGAVAVAAGAVLVARAANAAAEGAVRSLADYGQRMEQRVACLEAAEAAAARWEVAAADVVTINARIRLLAARAAKAGVSVMAPAPLRLTAGRDPAELCRWATAAQVELAKAQRELDAKLPPIRLSLSSAAVSPDLAAAFASHREALERRYVVADAPTPLAPTAVDGVLTLLDPDATTEERAEVLKKAAFVVKKPQEQDTYLANLRQVIVTDVNPKVARRRLAATWLQALEDGPLGETLAEARIPAKFAHTAERLGAVVAGTEDLTPTLQVEGTRMMAWAEETARQVFVLELVRDHLGEQGYQVEETFDVRNSVGLRLSRKEWEGEHTAEIRVEPHTTTVRGRVIRKLSSGSEEERQRDQTRCRVFADDFGAVGTKLAAHDPTATVSVDRQAPVDVVARKNIDEDNTYVNTQERSWKK